MKAARLRSIYRSKRAGKRQFTGTGNFSIVVGVAWPVCGEPLFCVAILLTGCVRRAGRNADCRWPGEAVPSNPPSSFHLSADAEFAEDLAVRYADTHFGSRSRDFESWAFYDQALARCKADMFEAVASTHRIDAVDVRNALGKNRTPIDVAEGFPYFLFYLIGAWIAIRRIWRLHPPGEDWSSGLILILLCSLASATAGVIGCEVWIGLIEDVRVGTGHLAYRGARLVWSNHRVFIFGVLLTAFWLLALIRARRELRGSSGGFPSDVHYQRWR